jgi:hypothetical protein
VPAPHPRRSPDDSAGTIVEERRRFFGVACSALRYKMVAQSIDTRARLRPYCTNHADIAPFRKIARQFSGCDRRFGAAGCGINEHRTASRA